MTLLVDIRNEGKIFLKQLLKNPPANPRYIFNREETDFSEFVEKAREKGYPFDNVILLGLGCILPENLGESARNAEEELRNEPSYDNMTVDEDDGKFYLTLDLYRFNPLTAEFKGTKWLELKENNNILAVYAPFHKEMRVELFKFNNNTLEVILQ